ncbi:hypothetical protein LRR81_17110 [Metabacillus sp. GX 13764]|uniref:hypothetical protein n=1 Tax=Metabacillus kandeliae TaxID=2900151 RepID=UPI001E538CF9|nr:hypothetical protein [Metabacillus kandeliae]MCD7035966.1 hypothetical protein [Metabacillus kandeliae]
MQRAIREYNGWFGEYNGRFGEYLLQIGEYGGWFGEYGTALALEIEFSLCKKEFSVLWHVMHA